MPVKILLTYIKKLGPRRFYFLVFCLFLILVLAILYFFNIFSLRNRDASSQDEARIIIEKVDKLVFLPKDETPTTAKVSNPELLADQVFFKDAKKGDIVLIYTNAKKAFLYDPVANKIVNISNINTGNMGNTTQTFQNLPTGDTKPSPTINEGQF